MRASLSLNKVLKHTVSSVRAVNQLESTFVMFAAVPDLSGAERTSPGDAADGKPVLFNIFKGPACKN